MFVTSIGTESVLLSAGMNRISDQNLHFFMRFFDVYYSIFSQTLEINFQKISRQYICMYPKYKWRDCRYVPNIFVLNYETIFYHITFFIWHSNSILRFTAVIISIFFIFKRICFFAELFLSRSTGDRVLLVKLGIHDPTKIFVLFGKHAFHDLTINELCEPSMAHVIFSKSACLDLTITDLHDAPTFRVLLPKLSFHGPMLNEYFFLVHFLYFGYF